MNCKNLNLVVWIFFVFFINISSSHAQTLGVFENKKFLVEVQSGLSFSWANLALADNSLSLEQEATFENAFKAEVGIGLNYSFTPNLLAGFNAGIGYLTYDTEQTGLSNSFTNYQFGPYLRYHVPLNALFSVFAQVGINQNFLNSNVVASSTYVHNYLDLGFNMKLKQKWWIYLKFQNLLYYYTDDFNFEDRSGFGISNPFTNFIDFPVFGVMYQLD
jgi:hypothetical protein